uniref:Uncharacterized protein n=1 Tax=Anguilla anguilla TaxID=7936 RepID=A0A0E9UMH1_ANGAN
MQRKQAKVLLF